MKSEIQSVDNEGEIKKGSVLAIHSKKFLSSLTEI